ncbi:MAG: hypothetical protein B7Y61_20225 [Rhizobiales bacterium 35-66-30]|nr:MAG: hypothetical protein B7Y61_20225 [Rhizobiales bacterium 35-66-30]
MRAAGSKRPAALETAPRPRRRASPTCASGSTSTAVSMWSGAADAVAAEVSGTAAPFASASAAARAWALAAARWPRSVVKRPTIWSLLLLFFVAEATERFASARAGRDADPAAGAPAEATGRAESR